MNDSIDDRLRESLADLSQPVEGAPSLVHRALAEVESGAPRIRAHGPAAPDAPVRWNSRVPGGLATIAIGLLVVVTAAAVFLPTLSASARRTSASVSDSRLEDGLEKDETVASADLFMSKAAAPAPAPTAPAMLRQQDAAKRDGERSAAGASMAAEAMADSVAAPDPEPQRIIIRTGTCEIRVDDVEVSRRTVEALLRPDLGEFVAEATVELDRTRPTAVLTVRIDAGRFDAFMDSLAGIGTVRSVAITASDATDQIVDLDARLRNERRVESEVLELLADRPDASLDDIVRVRRELADVRESIERMDAHRQSLLGRAALSTLRITLIGPAPEGARADPDRPAFGQRMGDAMRDGWRRCIGSAVWLAEFIVSGLLWWVVGAVLIWAAVRHHRWTSTWR